ncbi:MAG: N-6 DNA methylase [Candidatus Cloacimonetes bacterium]|nr:N-6 DNA methylase [Candidatus Cloacimonadota bacterium]
MKSKKNKIQEDLIKYGITTRQGIISYLIKNNFLNLNKNELFELLNWGNNDHNKRSIGLYYTPNKIAFFMAQIGKLFNPKSVLDPACGTGNILSYCDYAETKIGFDINSEVIKIAKYLNKNAVIYNRDFLSESIQKKYDLIISEFPIGRVISSKDRSGHYEEEFTNKCLDLLKDKGCLICIVPDILLYSSNMKSLRLKILNMFSLELIVNLPHKLFFNVPLSILTIQKKQQRGKVYLAIYNNNPDEIIKNYQTQQGEIWKNKEKLRERWDREYFLPKYIEIDQQLKREKSLLDLSEIADIIRGISLTRELRKSKGKYLIFRQDNYNHETGKFLNKTAKNEFIDIADEKYIIKAGDVVIPSFYTSFENSVPFFYNKNIPKIIVSSSHYIIRPKSKMRKDYLREYLSNDMCLNLFKTQLERVSYGVTIKHINGRNLGGIKIAIYEEDFFAEFKQEWINCSMKIMLDKMETYFKLNENKFYKKSKGNYGKLANILEKNDLNLDNDLQLKPFVKEVFKSYPYFKDSLRETFEQETEKGLFLIRSKLSLLQYIIDNSGDRFYKKSSALKVYFYINKVLQEKSIELVKEKELEKTQAIIQKEKEKNELKTRIFQAVSHTIGNFIWAEKGIIHKIKENYNTANDIRRMELYHELMLAIMNSIKISFSKENIIKSKIENDIEYNKSDKNISIYELLYFCLNMNIDRLIRGDAGWGSIRNTFFNIDKWENKNKYNKVIKYCESIYNSEDFLISDISHSEIFKFKNFFINEDFRDINRYFEIQIDELNNIFVVKNSYTFSILFIVLLELIKNMFRYGTVKNFDMRIFKIFYSSDDDFHKITFSNLIHKDSMINEESTLQGLEMVKEFLKVLGKFEKSEEIINKSDFKEFIIQIYFKKIRSKK